MGSKPTVGCDLLHRRVVRLLSACSKNGRFGKGQKGLSSDQITSQMTYLKSSLAEVPRCSLLARSPFDNDAFSS